MYEIRGHEYAMITVKGILYNTNQYNTGRAPNSVSLEQMLRASDHQGIVSCYIDRTGTGTGAGAGRDSAVAKPSIGGG